jgi:hypothetical protein
VNPGRGFDLDALPAPMVAAMEEGGEPIVMIVMHGDNKIQAIVKGHEAAFAAAIMLAEAVADHEEVPALVRFVFAHFVETVRMLPGVECGQTVTEEVRR